MEELSDYWWKKVTSASRLCNNEGLSSHSSNTRVCTFRANGPQGSWLIRLDVWYQGSWRTFLPDTQP